jgi:hypothetical protein
MTTPAHSSEIQCFSFAAQLLDVLPELLNPSPGRLLLPAG